MSRPKPVRIGLIGKEVTIVASENQQIVGFTGHIIDETKNTIRIRKTKDNKNVDKIFQKQKNTFRIDDKIINGNQITGRIEERIKK